MGKYKIYDHPSGRVAVGDIIAAFVPSAKGREVKHATVTKINRLSINAKYWDKGWYDTTLKDHQWCYVRTAEDEFVDRDTFDELQRESLLLTSLYAEGVVDWEGWQAAVNRLEKKLEGEVGY